MQQNQGDGDQAESADGQQRPGQRQAGEHAPGAAAARSPRPTTPRTNVQVSAVTVEYDHGSGQAQRPRGGQLHVGEQVPVEAGQHGGNHGRAGPFPEPGVEVGKHHHRGPGQVAGDDRHPGVQVGPPQRGQPGIKRRLEGDRTVGIGLGTGAHLHDVGHLVEDHAIEHGQGAQAPPGAGGIQVPAAQGVEAREHGDEHDQRERHGRSRRRPDQGSSPGYHAFEPGPGLLPRPRHASPPHARPNQGPAEIAVEIILDPSGMIQGTLPEPRRGA
jgi:hypothetical protein